MNKLAYIFALALISINAYAADAPIEKAAAPADKPAPAPTPTDKAVAPPDKAAITAPTDKPAEVRTPPQSGGLDGC
jgi:hypothetical protein